MCVCVCVCVYVFTYIHTYTLIYIHIYTYTYINPVGKPVQRVVCVYFTSRNTPLPSSHNKHQRNAPQPQHTKCRAGQYQPETHGYRKHG